MHYRRWKLVVKISVPIGHGQHIQHKGTGHGGCHGVIAGIGQVGAFCKAEEGGTRFCVQNQAALHFFCGFNHFSCDIFQIDSGKFLLANNSSPLKGSVKGMEILFCPCSLANLESSQLRAFIFPCLKIKCKFFCPLVKYLVTD